MKMTCLAGLLAAVAALAPGAVAAAGTELPPSITRHSIVADGRTLAYEAEIGRTPIRDAETGEVLGWMGYVAYRIPSGTGSPRPLTFVWNGGPGAASSTLHFEVVGPKRGEGAVLVDNAETWLSFTDLVFVDPIGTGFSRPTKAEYAKYFYSTPGDVASVTEFVRAWRLTHGAEDAPIYLAGESWGAGRAGSVGHALLSRGIPVKGLVLISGGSGLDVRPVSRELSTALRVVDWAQVALFHGKLGAGLPQDAEALRSASSQWARETYAPALQAIATLSPAERGAIAADLSRYTGVPAAQIDLDSLVITPRQFRESLLRDEGKVINTFDMRLTHEPSNAFDPLIPRYFRHALGYRTDLPYVGSNLPARGTENLEDGFLPGGRAPVTPSGSWNYATREVTEDELAAAIAQAVETGGGPPRLGPPLPSTGEAIALDPTLQVLVVAGQHDSLNSCAANDETARNLPDHLRSTVAFKCYVGGHMFYRDQPSRLAFSRDVRALIGR